MAKTRPFWGGRGLRMVCERLQSSGGMGPEWRGHPPVIASVSEAIQSKGRAVRLDCFASGSQ
ncbi:hypothetical protein GCM10007036_08610 [Alsobacter metallidurans]|uniref:Uncharacterized protein n=1 Tax=Alsobacter metallidurans TaxID=340221 RepID=A0A917MGN0_9HYPH|nr:hypothetical protein GCM10007036_08610 [Alsobacter metallidurans]